MPNIWIGNLQNAATDDTLMQLFSPFGTIDSCRVVYRPKGTCGLVYFRDQEAADAAIRGMDHCPFDGKFLTVKPARAEIPSQPPPAPVGIPGRTNICLNDLPHWYMEPEIDGLCRAYGEIISMRVVRDKRSGRNRGIAMVNYSTPEAAADAIVCLNGHWLPEAHKPLSVEYATSYAPSQPMPAGIEPAVLPEGCSVWVGNLPPHYERENVFDLFAPFGEVVSVILKASKKSYRAERSALVGFAHPDAAAEAIHHLNGYPAEEGHQPMSVRYDRHDPIAPSAPVSAPPPFSAAPPRPPPARPAAKPRSDAMPTHLWVGNLPASCTEEELRKLFTPHGIIKTCSLLSERSSKGPGREGLVDYREAGMAVAAIQALSGMDLPGCKLPLIVKYATPDMLPTPAAPPAKAAAPPVAAAAEPKETPSERLWLTNVPLTMNEVDLVDLFSPYGQVASCILRPFKRSSRITSAEVRFSSVAEATAALEALNGLELDPAGSPLLVRFYRERPLRPAPAPAAHYPPAPAYTAPRGMYHRAPPRPAARPAYPGGYAGPPAAPYRRYHPYR